MLTAATLTSYCQLLRIAASIVRSAPNSKFVTCQCRSLDSLKQTRLPELAPARGEVLLEVHAVGVNFRDVLNVLGMYPGDPGAPGADCAGIVMVVGAGVTALSPGDSSICCCFKLLVVSELHPTLLTWQLSSRAAVLPLAAM